MSAFDDAFAVLVDPQHEGGYSNNPADPGGETMWGVTARVARRHGYMGAMKDLPLATAKQIAKAEYWDAVRGDELDPALAFQLLDAAYNAGPPQAVKWLQRAAGVVADGAFGPATMVAVRAMPTGTLIARFNGHRLAFLADLSTWPGFGRGWARRIANNLQRVAQ